MGRPVPARFPADLSVVRQLFTAYEASQHAPACFVDFDEEMANLPGPYGEPHGCILLATAGDTPVGCVALRRASAAAGEIKRLYVEPPFRRRGVGRSLVQEILHRARRRGYGRVELETLPDMTAAVALYASLGFTPGAAAGGRAVPGALVMEYAWPAVPPAGATPGTPQGRGA